MTRRTVNSKRRSLAVAAAALTSAAALSGCGQVTNPWTTDLHYDAADGVSATVGDLQAENLLIVNDGKDSKGKVAGLVANSGDEDRTLTISAPGASDVTVTVPAGKSVRLDGQSNGNDDAKVSPVSLSSIDGAKVGDQISVTLKTNPGGATKAEVPVLLDQPPYGSAKVEHAEDEQPKPTEDVGIDH